MVWTHVSGPCKILHVVPINADREYPMLSHQASLTCTIRYGASASVITRGSLAASICLVSAWKFFAMGEKCRPSRSAKRRECAIQPSQTSIHISESSYHRDFGAHDGENKVWESGCGAMFTPDENVP